MNAETCQSILIDSMRTAVGPYFGALVRRAGAVLRVSGIGTDLACLCIGFETAAEILLRCTAACIKGNFGVDRPYVRKLVALLRDCRKTIRSHL